MDCPGCRGQLVFDGHKHACDHCGGSLVGAGALLAMLRAASGDPQLEIENRCVPLLLKTVRCPACTVWMRAFALDGISLDRCAEHGIWFDGNELERLIEKHTHVRRPRPPTPAALDSAHLDELARRLGVEITARGRAAAFVEAGAAITIEPRLARVTVELAELAGFELVVRLGNAGSQHDAELGDPRFDREWTVLTPAPELARVVLSPAVRAELEVARTVVAEPGTAPSIVVRNGRATIELPGRERDLPAVAVSVQIARLLARRMRELHEELDAIVTAFGGRRESGPWSWQGGFAAVLPAGELSAALRLGADRRGRLATTLVLDGAPLLPWGLVAKRTSYDADEPWRSAALKGYVVGGSEPDLRALHVVLANPDWIELGDRSEMAGRCAIGWLGWVPALATVRAGLELGGAIVGAGPSMGPYR